MIPLSVLGQVTGYRSHYLFDETDALAIRATGCSQGFSQYIVSADQVIIDLDDGDASVVALEARINALGYGYELWESGGKGWHFVLFHELIRSADLPFSHRCFVLDLAPTADLSLYRHSSLISLPGRKHPKTGRKKKLIRKKEGSLVTFAMKQNPIPEFKLKAGGGLSLTVAGLNNFATMALIEPQLGNRHTKIWSASKQLADAGWEFDTVLGLACEVNNTWKTPKSNEEVRAAVFQAYSARSSGGVSSAQSDSNGLDTATSERSV